MAVKYRPERDEQQNIVIISYDPRDSDEGKKLRNDLNREGIETWSDEDIIPGQSIEDEVRKAIRKSIYYIILLSSNSVSKKGPLQRRLKDALDKQKEFPECDIYVIPARLDDCDISELELARLQYADMFPDWDKGFKRLLQAIKIEEIKQPQRVSPNLESLKKQVEKIEAEHAHNTLESKIKHHNLRKYFLVGILILSIIITVSISFYIIKINNAISYASQQIAAYNSTISQQAENYRSYISQNDRNMLDKFVNSLYPVYEGLENIITPSIFSNQSNLVVLKNMSGKDPQNNKYLVDEALHNDRQHDPPYGLLNESREQGKRAFLNTIINNFKQKYDQNASVAYTFIATDGCWMYMLQPYSTQLALSQGWYPHHPWCPEFESSKNYELHYVTEPYYASTVKDIVSTVMVPVADSNYPHSQNVTYVGAALNLEKFVDKFFQNHGLDKEETKLLLLVSHADTNKEIYEPLWKAWDGSFKNKYNIPIPLHQNSSLNNRDKDILINNLSLFDTNAQANWQPVSLHIGNYAITATSVQQDGDNNKYPIQDNKERSVSWEWILIRKSTYPYSIKPLSLNTLRMPYSMYPIPNDIIYLLPILSAVGMIATSYKLGKDRHD